MAQPLLADAASTARSRAAHPSAPGSAAPHLALVADERDAERRHPRPADAHVAGPDRVSRVDTGHLVAVASVVSGLLVAWLAATSGPGARSAALEALVGGTALAVVGTCLLLASRRVAGRRFETELAALRSEV